MSVRGLLNKKVTIKRVTEVMSDTREVTNDWDEIETNVPCSITSRSADSSLQDYGVQVEFDFLAYFEPDVDLKPADEEGPRDQIVDADGTTYNVVFVRDITGRSLYKQALLRRIA